MVCHCTVLQTGRGANDTRVTVVVWLICQLSPAQEEDTAIVSDTTDDLWFLTEGESEQVSVEMKEAALEEGSRGEGEAPPDDEDGSGGKEEKADREVRVWTKLDLLPCLSSGGLFCFVTAGVQFGFQLVFFFSNWSKVH